MSKYLDLSIEEINKLIKDKKVKPSELTIEAFDSSHLVVAVAGSNAQVIVNKYGDAQVECIGSGIKVNNTGKSTLLSPSECE